ncbi:MAG: chemotaxis protein CheB [Lachnospiraceae bacterium]|nr:chemotaxis protein CheB [Lachnospiraceae bacterium]
MSDTIVVIASSTGGPAALMQVLPHLPEDFPCPVVVVQHIWPGFSESLTDSLKEKCILPVHPATEGHLIENGNIYVAFSEHHIKIKKMPAHHHVFFYSEEETKRGSAKPSADILLESLADSGYANVLAVVLTGMGSDGTKGIIGLSKKKRVHVLAQDEESCVVYGMPGAVAEEYGDCEIVELSKMAGRISECVKMPDE